MILINIEGTDGSGKLTQSRLLCEYLNKTNRSSILHSFPTYFSPSSAPIKMYLGGEFGDNVDCLDAYQASTLYAVDRMCTMKKYTFTNPNDIIILDRYTPSNLIHQASKIRSKTKREKCIRWIENFEYNTLKCPVPNIVIFLAMPTSASYVFASKRGDLKAGTKKDIHESDLEYLDKCYTIGMEIAKQKNWHIVDCVDKNNNVKNIEEVQKEIVEIVDKYLKTL